MREPVRNGGALPHTPPGPCRPWTPIAGLCPETLGRGQRRPLPSPAVACHPRTGAVTPENGCGHLDGAAPAAGFFRRACD